VEIGPSTFSSRHEVIAINQLPDIKHLLKTNVQSDSIFSSAHSPCGLTSSL